MRTGSLLSIPKKVSGVGDSRARGGPMIRFLRFPSALGALFSSETLLFLRRRDALHLSNELAVSIISFANARMHNEETSS